MGSPSFLSLTQNLWVAPLLQGTRNGLRWARAGPEVTLVPALPAALDVAWLPAEPALVAGDPSGFHRRNQWLLVRVSCVCSR